MKKPFCSKCLPLIAAMALIGLTGWAQPTVQFPVYGYTFDEAAGVATVPVHRTGDVAERSTVEYFTIELSAVGGLDFTPTTGLLTFPPGSMDQTVTVPILNNGLVQGSRYFRLVLTNASSASLGSPSVALVTLVDNDKGAEFALDNYYVKEGCGTAYVGVVRGQDGPGEVRLTCTSGDMTATNGIDYIWGTNTITFALGENYKLFAVPILNNGVKGGWRKLFRLYLTEATGTVLASRKTTTIAIDDDDRGITFQVPIERVNECTPMVVLNVLRGSDNTNGTLSVDYETTSLAAKAGEDFVATSGKLSFAPGELVKPLQVQILNDGVKEGDESFRVMLSNPSDTATGLGTNATVTVVVADNDQGFQFRLVPTSEYHVFEHLGVVKVGVLRGSDAQTDASVDYTTMNPTSGNAATAGIDYISTNGTLTFAAGEQEKTIEIRIIPDGVAELDERFRVLLTNASGGMSPTAAIVNILDSQATEPHHIASIACRPDAGLQMRLGGTVDSHFTGFFDIYPVDYSSDLVSWHRLTTLVTTNGAAAPPELTDSPGAAVHTRFYRTAGGPWISAWPGLPGPFPVGVVHRQLCDPTRLNRYNVPTNGSFMVTIIYPAQKTTGTPATYLDRAIATDPTWLSAYGGAPEASYRLSELVSHAVADAPPVTNSPPFPVVVVSPGLTGMRQFFTYMGGFLASHGYVVVTVDHGDAYRTVLADGRYLQGTQVSFEGRLADLDMVMRELRRWNSSDVMFNGKFDMEKVAGLGTSYGVGTVSYHYLHNNGFKALIHYDGGNNYTGSQVEVPILMIRAGTETDATVYDRTSRDAVWFNITGAEHMIIACPDFYWAWMPKAISTGQEITRTMSDYTLWFLNKHLKGTADAMPNPKEYPLISNFKHK